MFQSCINQTGKNAEYIPEIGLCSLGAIVAGNTQDSEWEDVSYYTVLMIDNVIELMDYPFPQLNYTAKARRSIGVGITNLAYDMASKGYKYSTLGGKRYIHRLAEMHSYYFTQSFTTSCKRTWRYVNGLIKRNTLKVGCLSIQQIKQLILK